MHKKGVSPLVATILLVAFAVALGGVVMSWGQNIIIEGAAGGASCLDINLVLNELGSRKVCIGGAGAGGYIDYVLDNDSPFNINAVSLWVFGEGFDHSSIVQVTDIPESTISSGAPLVGRTAYNFLRFGTPNRLVFVPKIQVEDKPVFCYDNALILEDVPSC